MGLKEALDYTRYLWLIEWLQKLPNWGQGCTAVLLSVMWEAWYLARQFPHGKMRAVWRSRANCPRLQGWAAHTRDRH